MSIAVACAVAQPTVLGLEAALSISATALWFPVSLGTSDMRSVVRDWHIHDPYYCLSDRGLYSRHMHWQCEKLVEAYIYTYAVRAKERTRARVPWCGDLRSERLSEGLLRRKVKRPDLSGNGVDIERSVPPD